MAVICTKRVPAKMVNWRSANPCIEASQLGRTGQEFAQIYDDACDIGVVFVNEDTGNEACFYVTADIGKSYDGELMCYYLKPTSETVRRFPNLRNIVITVYND